MRRLPLALPLLALPLLAFPLATLACSSADNPTGAGGNGGAGAGGGTTTSSSSSTGSAGPTGLLSGTVQRYTYAFNLATAHATSNLDVDVAPPGGDCFAVSCELPSASMGLWNGTPAKSATVASNALTFCGDQGVAGGAKLNVAADVDVLSKTFFGLDVGFSKKKNMDGGTFTYLLSWVGGCDRFGPCDDDPSRFASFHFDVTHAQGDVVLCPGVVTPGATLTQCELSGTLAPTYSAFAIASDPLWKRTDLLTVAGTNIVFYEVPSGQIAKSLDLASVTAFFQWITSLLGPLPYGKELRFAGAPTAWLGFEHPANIILHQHLPQQGGGAYINPTMHVLMHEVVHQWAGDRSTIATSSDFAWKEATAEYLSYVFEDEQRPLGEAASSLAYWDSVSLQSNHYPRPTDNPPPAVQSFYGDVYGPGPMVFYVQLETMLGRQTVLDGIKGFLAQPGARSVDDLRKALDAASGQDLKPYFDAWVFGTGKPEWPTFDVTTSQMGNQVTVTVTQKNLSQKLYGCKLDVQVNGATQSALATVDFGLAPKSDKATTTVTLAELVMSTTVDPKHRVVGRVFGVPVAESPKLKVWIL